MDSWISGLAQHGYSILFAVVFLEAVGLPVPAALALLIAGGAVAHGALLLPMVLIGAAIAMLAGDTLMYLLGRYTGWWLLGILCRISLNPESCILRAADSFYRRGRALLVIAKFIPGINSMAPPLAGSMNMRFLAFLRLDLLGASLYIGTFFGVGFAFSGALQALTRGYQTFGRMVGFAVVALLGAYAALQIWLWLKTRAQHDVAIEPPTQVAHAVATGAHIYDVRSHGYFDAKATRIKGSRRLDPNALNQSVVEFPSDGPIYLYCTCVREATSARVARELQKQGVRVAVIKGGLRAWRKAGLPLEPVPTQDSSRRDHRVLCAPRIASQ